MELLFNLNLKHHISSLKYDYINYNLSELGENLFWGKIIILNQKNDYLLFEADLLKFSYDIYSSLVRLDSKEDDSKEYLSNMYQLYQLELRREKKNVFITFNKKHTVCFNRKKLILKIKHMKVELLEDFKILFPNYKDIVCIDSLIDLMSK